MIWKYIVYKSTNRALPNALEEVSWERSDGLRSHCSMFVAVRLYCNHWLSEHKREKWKDTSHAVEDNFGAILSAVQWVSSIGSALLLTARGLMCVGRAVMLMVLYVFSPAAMTKDRFKCWVWDFCEKQVGIDFAKITVLFANPGPFTRQIGLFFPWMFVGQGTMQKKCRCYSWWWLTKLI